MKIRIKFEKGEPVKYISHLDMMRTFERAFRRAALPLAFSQGFTPHPRIVFASALSVGVTSSGEYMDVELEEEMAVEDVARRLNLALPEGLKILRVDLAEGRWDLSQINDALYTVKISADATSQEIDDAIKKLMAQDQIIMDKVSKGKKRKVDIRPLIYNFHRVDISGQDVLLSMELAVGQKGTVSPQALIYELAKVLGKNVEAKVIHRENLFLRKGEKKILPL